MLVIVVDWRDSQHCHPINVSEAPVSRDMGALPRLLQMESSVLRAAASTSYLHHVLRMTQLCSLRHFTAARGGAAATCLHAGARGVQTPTSTAKQMRQCSISQLHSLGRQAGCSQQQQRCGRHAAPLAVSGATASNAEAAPPETVARPRYTAGAYRAVTCSTAHSCGTPSCAVPPGSRAWHSCD